MYSSNVNTTIKKSAEGFGSLSSAYAASARGGMASRSASTSLRGLPINTGHLPTARIPGQVNLEPHKAQTYTRLASMNK